VVAVAAKDALGEYGERVAARHLTGAGMAVVERRWRCRHGEIDIVAVDPDPPPGGSASACLVVCEVKTRRSLAAGLPVDAVTPAKLARLRRLAGLWLAQQDAGFAEVRIDVVSVVVPRRGGPIVEHLRGVG
jgi:putative endonuclease